MVATEPAQAVELGAGLDALDDAGDLHVVAETGERLDDLVADRIVVDVGHEAAVDLELVERQAMDVAQRGIAGAEIVQRDAAAASSEAKRSRPERA